MYQGTCASWRKNYSLYADSIRLLHQRLDADQLAAALYRGLAFSLSCPFRESKTKSYFQISSVEYQVP